MTVIDISLQRTESKIIKAGDIITTTDLGELNISELIENIRCEGCEIAISQPKVIFRIMN